VRTSRLLALALTASAAVGARAAEEPQAAPGPTQQVVAGRPAYDQSWFYRKTFGEGYRTLWTTPITVPVLQLPSFAGGLTPVRQVGSMQSIGLALKGADGKSYTYRVLDKDPTKILPPEWKGSLPAYIFQDQTSSSHPGTAYIVPTLAEAADVPHVAPRVVFMPDDAALGTFRATFGGTAGTIEEYPTAAGEGYAGFQGATEILSTAKLWESWLKGTAWVDRQALLRARIFDLFLSDWDRHNGQWRWMRLPGREDLVALPEDRDQALSNYSGVLMSVARQVAPRLLSWRHDYENLAGLLYQGREIDDWLLTGVERKAFVETARDVQGRLTDAVIEQAVHQLPPEWYAVGGDGLIADLKKRRDLLPQAAEGFYENLSRYADVQGTDGDDVARLTREADGSALLEVSRTGADGTSRTYFKRRFLPKETKEVRIYLYGGADRFTSSGPPGDIKFRLSADGGEDRLDDSKSGGTRFYDVDDPAEVVKGPGTGVSTAAWTRLPRKKETPWLDKQDFGSLTPYQPLLWWEPDPGVVLAFNVTHYRYGFRKQPYSSMQHLGLEYKTKRSAFRIGYNADIRWARPGVATYLDAYYDGAENYNFFGIGNETPFSEDDALIEAHQSILYGFPSLFAYENKRRTYWLAVGPEVKYASNAAPDSSLLATTQPYGFGDFGETGARFTLELDTRGRRLLGMETAGFAPGTGRRVTGLKGELNGRLIPKAWDVRETFGIASGSLTGYWLFGKNWTLAGRVGGQKNWGDYPWFEAAFLGGSDSVRGYDRNRFAGDSSFYTNAQLMLALFNMNFIMPLRVGVLGLADAGRVWVKGEASEKWHPAYGGGIFVRILTTEAIFHALLAQGDEGLKFYVNFGFGI
jgi:hemolysin secretion/activation protein ShlB/FhaC/HecB